jgi:hypothetical protein
LGMSRGILISDLNISTNSDSTDMMECPRVNLRTGVATVKPQPKHNRGGGEQARPMHDWARTV